MAEKRIIVVGAGGFVREVCWLIREIDAFRPEYRFLGYVVSDLSRVGEQNSRVEILGDYQWLLAHRNAVDALAIGTGTPAARLEVSVELERDFGPERWPVLVQPSAGFDASSTPLGHGVLLCASVIATVNVEIAPFTRVNLGCTLGHEAQLGRGCVLNTTVNISGAWCSRTVSSSAPVPRFSDTSASARARPSAPEPC